MLTPAQVIPFLTHDELLVRSFALRYLEDTHDPSPATADDVWRMIDRFGFEPEAGVARGLTKLPQTDTSVTRLLQILPTVADEYDRQKLFEGLRWLELPLAERHWDQIQLLANLPDAVRVMLERRMAYQGLPAEELWTQLEEHARKLNEHEEYPPDADTDVVTALIEAVGRHPDVLGERVLAGLRDDTIHDWREVVYTEAAGRMKCAPAIDSLIEKLADEDSDILAEEAVKALVDVGTVETVDKVRRRYASMEWGPRLSAADVLGRIKRPESVQAIVSLLPAERDRESYTSLCLALCELCPTDPDALELLRRAVVDGRYDKQMADIRSDLYAVCRMTGYSPPELHKWEIHAREAERSLRELSKMIRDMDAVLPDAEDEEETAEPLPLPPPPPAPEYEPLVPIRRQTPKVGRNDPCPCGSGKKYKKCCGNNA